MKQFVRKVYNYWNYLCEILVRIKTILWYKQLFGIIGKHCAIFTPLRLIAPNNIFIGSHVRIYKDSRIETIESWGDTKFSPTILIGNKTTIEQRLHLICASKVEIGDDVVISADVMITDNNHQYAQVNKSVMYQPLEVKETVIGSFCFIGMGAKIMAGVKLGNNCIVGSNSVVIGEFPPYCVIAGMPAKILKRYDFAIDKWRKTSSVGEFINEV